MPAHSEKQDATATWKKTFGHHHLKACVDHGSGGSGEQVAALLGPGNARSDTAPTTSPPLNSPWPNCRRSNGRGRRPLIRTDSGGGTHDCAWVAELSGDCLKGWPQGMRLIVRKERPHPGRSNRRNPQVGAPPPLAAVRPPLARTGVITDALARICPQGILSVLHNDTAWQLLPLELGFGSGQICWRRLGRWQQARVFNRLHRACSPS